MEEADFVITPLFADMTHIQQMLQHMSQICRQTDARRLILTWNTRLPFFTHTSLLHSLTFFTSHTVNSTYTKKHKNVWHTPWLWTQQNQLNKFHQIIHRTPCIPWISCHNSHVYQLRVWEQDQWKLRWSDITCSEKSVYTSSTRTHPLTQFVYNCKKWDE